MVRPTDEACRIVIMLDGAGGMNVAAPMKHKALCYDILKDARTVIERTDSALFRPLLDRIVIVMNMAGRVDVDSPLPPRDLCCQMLKQARSVIERYNDATAPPMKAFSDKMLGL